MTRPAQGAIDALAEFAATASAGGRVPRLALHAADAVTARLAGGATAEGRALQCLLQRIDQGEKDELRAEKLTELRALMESE